MTFILAYCLAFYKLKYHSFCFEKWIIYKAKKYIYKKEKSKRIRHKVEDVWIFLSLENSSLFKSKQILWTLFSLPKNIFNEIDFVILNAKSTKKGGKKLN